MVASSIGKVVILIGILSSFLLLSGQAEVTGWGDFVTQVTSDPFETWPGWPTFGGPTGDVFGSTWYLVSGGTGIGMVRCEAHRPLSTTIGGAGATETISVNGNSACWSAMNLDSIAAGTLNVSLDLTSGGSTTWTARLMAAEYGCDIFGCFWRDIGEWAQICIWASETTVGDNVVRSCDTATGWTFGDFGDGGRRFTIVITKNSGDDLGIKFNGAPESDSFVQITPGILGSSDVCRWDRPGSWGTCIGDATAWIGNALLYIGGMFWAIATGVFSVLTWLVLLVIAFFGAILGMLGYLAGGAGLPSPISDIFRIIFVGFLAMFFYIIFAAFRGSEP